MVIFLLVFGLIGNLLLSTGSLRGVMTDSGADSVSDSISAEIGSGSGNGGIGSRSIWEVHASG